MNLESFTEREKENEARQTSALILRLKKSSLGRAVMVNNLNFYYLIRSYFYTNGAEALVFCVNDVEEEHPFLDRSTALPFLIGQREVTDKNRLL